MMNVCCWIKVSTTTQSIISALTCFQIFFASSINNEWQFNFVLLLLSSRHRFHIQCIMQWRSRSEECPMCFKTVQLKVSDSKRYNLESHVVLKKSETVYFYTVY